MSSRPARRIGFLGLLALASCTRSQTASDAGPTRTQTTSEAAVDASSAPVVVAIVVDQLAAWIAVERWPLLPKDGGFARLLREGTYVRALRYAHAVTDTAPGHAALFTGAVPRESGVFSNEIPNIEGDNVSILRDEAVRVVYPNVIDPQVSASAAHLKVDTVADRLRKARPDSVVIGLSLKDRGAILPVGQRPTVALWLDTKQSRFVTSTAFGPTFPVWAEKRGDQSAVLATMREPWVRSTDAGGPTPDNQPGEGDESGLGITFPHRFDAVRAPARAFRTTPQSDEVLFGLALDALDAERKAGAPTFLSLSLSANDYIAHVFGPDSWEAWDELFRLDRALARFLSELDRRFGSNGYAIALAADHGGISMPEVMRMATTALPWCARKSPDPWARPCNGGVRVPLTGLRDKLRAEVGRAFGKDRESLIRGVADPFVFVSGGARALPATERAKLDAVVERVLAKTPGVRRTFRVDDLPATCPPIEHDDAADEEARIAALVCRSVAPKSGDHAGGYYVVTTPGSFFDPEVVVGAGTSHGTPYLYDRTVPFVVRAPARVAAGREIPEAVDFRAFARSVSALLGIEPPPAAAGGRDITK